MLLYWTHDVQNSRELCSIPRNNIVHWVRHCLLMSRIQDIQISKLLSKHTNAKTISYVLWGGRILFSLSREVIMDGKSDDEICISRAGGHRLVKRRGIPACLMKEWHIDTGIDPCLMICICTIYDKMDVQNWGGHNIVAEEDRYDV